MASKTQLRLTQVTGSLVDTENATASINETSIQGVLNHLASAVKRIHGGSSFSSAAAGAVTAITSSAGVNVGGDLNVTTSAVIGTDILIGDDAFFNSDAAVINFGADDDVSLTHVADTGLLLNGTAAPYLQLRDSAIFVGSSADGVLDIEADTTINIGNDNSGVAISIGHTTSEVTVNDNLTVTGDLTVNGTTTTVNTTNLLVTDKLITLNDGGAAASAGGSGIEFEEDGSPTGYIKTAADRAGFEFNAPGNANVLTIDATATSTLDMGANLTVEGASTINQDVTTDASVTFGDVTANGGVVIDNITIDGTEIDLSSGDLTLDVAGDIILDADSNVVRIKDGGTERGILTQDAALGFVLSSSAGTNLALDSNSGTVIFSQEGGNPGVSVTAMELGANTVNFGLSGESGITEGFIQFNNSGAQVISGSTGLKLDAGANSAALQLKSDNANTFSFKAPGALGGSYTVLMPGNGNIAVGKVLKVNNNLGGGEWGLDWASESVASYEKGAKVIAGGVVNAGTGVDFSAVDHGDAPTSLQVAYANADVFVNGQLLLSGTEANRAGGTVDYTVSGAQELKFAFNLENDDIVSVFVRG